MPKGDERRMLDTVESFIVQSLPQKLQRDLHDGRIVKEADLETAAYFHLRQFLGDAVDWKILARKHVPATGYRVDLVLFRGGDAAFAFELKWAKDSIGPKDEDSLASAIKELGIQRAFWMSALPEEGPATEIMDGGSKNVLHILLRPGLTGEALVKWKTARRRFTKDMDGGVRSRAS